MLSEQDVIKWKRQTKIDPIIRNLSGKTSGCGTRGVTFNNRDELLKTC